MDDDTPDPEVADEEPPPGSLPVHQRYARVPGRGVESRLRYWAHRFPAGLRLGGLAAVLGTGLALGFLASLGTFFLYLFAQGRLNRPFDLLLSGEVEEAETAAREALESEEPGPVADEYLTVLAIARACQGDREGARETMARREAPLDELWGLHPRLHRPLGAAAFEALGEPGLAVDLLQDVDPAMDESGLVLLKANTLVSARRYRAAQRALELLVDRTSTPPVLKVAHGLFLTLARETWDPEIEKLARSYDAETGQEWLALLEARSFLAEVREDRQEARALVTKLLTLGAEESGLRPSDGFLDWHRDLYGAWLEEPELDEAALERALEDSLRAAEELDPAERASVEGGFLQRSLHLALALRRGDVEAALLPGCPDAVLDARGAVLRAARIRLLLDEARDEGAAAAELMAARAAAGESPGVLLAAAWLRRERGRELDPEDELALARARFAAALFPSPLRGRLD